MKLFSTIIVLSSVFILTACAASTTDSAYPWDAAPTALSGEVYSESPEKSGNSQEWQALQVKTATVDKHNERSPVTLYSSI